MMQMLSFSTITAVSVSEAGQTRLSWWHQVVGLSPEQATTSPLKREVVAKPYSSDVITVYWLQHSFWDKIEYH